MYVYGKGGWKGTLAYLCFSLGIVDAPLKPQASWRLSRDVHGCLFAEHAVIECLRCREIGLEG